MQTFPKHITSRKIYLDKVKPFINQSLVKVLVGQRRVGKSYLLFQIMQYIQENFSNYELIYLNLEDFEFRFIKTAEDLHTYLKSQISNDKKNYIFIDEIQTIDSFEDVVRSLLLDPNIDLYITGSNANLLSGELATRLAGRSIEVEVFSLSYQEFLEFHEFTSSMETVLKYLTWGGLPYLIHLEKNNNVIFEYLKNVYASILFRDIVSRFNIRTSAFLEDLVRYLADSTGSIFSANRISEYLKSQRIDISHNQVKLYINYLKDAFLIQAAPRFDIVGKRHFEFGEKYYFENLGIRNALIGYRATDLNKLLENAIFNHLRTCGYSIKVGVLNQFEIDFIAEKNNERIYLQASLKLDSDKTIEREFGNLAMIKDDFPKYVITLDDQFQNTVNGIKTLRLEDFLLTTF